MRKYSNVKFALAASQSIALCAALVVLVVAVYGQFLWNPIIFDDLPFFNLDDSGQQAVTSFRFSLFELRSLPYATLAWTKEWFGLDLIYFRIGNMLLHAAVVLALFGFLSSLFGALWPTLDAKSLTPKWLAFFTASLFAVHPVATYGAGYLVQRTIVMATLFGVLSMWAYVYGSVRCKSLWIWISVLCYYLAVFSKEHVLLLPGVLVALTVLLYTDWQIQLRKRWIVYLVLAVIGIFVLMTKRGIVGSVYEINAAEMLGQNGNGFSYPRSVITQSWFFFKYAFFWVFPNPSWMSIDMREPFASSVYSPYLLAATCYIVWGATAIVLLFKRGYIGLVGFAMLYPWILFFIEFSTVRIQESFVLYRSYLWAAGGFCVLPLLLAKMDKRIASVIVALTVLAMVPISMDRLVTMSHPIILWSDAEKLVSGRSDLPGAARIYYNRGNAYVHNDMDEAAIQDYKRAIELEPSFVHAHGNLGVAYFKQGNWKLAAQEFGAAIHKVQAVHGEPMPHFIHGRAQAYEKLGDMANAQLDYQQSCQLARRGCDKLTSSDTFDGK